jgi:spermidine synthase
MTESKEVSGLGTATLYFCFFVSGVAGLVYEVLWAKYLSLYVGSTGLAQVIVLATFMGGLALGSQVLGAVADRVASPLKMYAFLELGIGVYALLFDHIFVAGREVFIAVARSSGLTAGGLVSGKIISCVLSVLLPTFLMGGTLPAMGRYMMRTLNVVGPRVSRLYFLNSLGAAFGCLLAGFYLIGRFGLQFSMVAGAMLNILAGLVSLLVLSRETAAAAPASVEQLDEGERLSSWATAIVLAGVGISGAVSMMYEVGWIRLLTLVLGSSTYSFSLMLAAFILGLAIGSFLLSFRKRTTGYALIFGLSETAVGLTVLLMLPLYVKLPFWFNQLAASLNREPATFGLYQFCTFFMCALVMIVPTILQGITFPAAMKVLIPDMRRVGRRIGYAYAVNTVGTLAGSVGAGFLGLPFLGIKGTLELAVALNSVLGLAIVFTERRPELRRRGLAVASIATLAVWAWYGVAMGPWDRLVLTAGTYRTRQRIPSFERLRAELANRQTLFYRDGIDATIAVQDLKGEKPQRILVINGKTDASTGADMPTQKIMAHLPMMIHPRPEKVLIVGVGSGATIGSVLAYEGVKQIDVVEICRDVIDASRLFDSVNGRYWEDPRVRVFWEDAKTFLQIADTQYDVIISEPTNPWIAGVAGVFSREYFDTCRRHLAPGGFFVQWIQGYELEDSTFYMILETFTGIFPCYTLWNPSFSDTVLVGSPEPYGPDFDRMGARVRQPGVQRDLATMELSSILPILGFQMADYASRPSHVNWLGAIHSDFFPVLEYVAPRGFFLGTRAKGVKLLDRRSRSPENARLWVQDYLDARPVSAADLRQCFVFASSRQGLFEGAAAAWAREWVRRFPEDPAAQTAGLESSPQTYTGSVDRGRLKKCEKDEFWGLVSGKALCRFGYDDYIASRNYLEPGKAQAVLATIREVMARYPEEKDPQLFRWCGQLEYDLGLYSESASDLSTAVELLHAQNGKRDDIIDAGLALCESLLAMNDRGRAMSVCDGPLAPYGVELKVALMKSRIRDAL